MTTAADITTALRGVFDPELGAEETLAVQDLANQCLAARDVPTLLDYRRQAPGAVQAHPSDEHLLPLYVALGAGGETAQAQRFHAGIDDYVIAMDAYSFLPQ